MKVLLINGSAKEKGCTFTALSEVARGLNESGVETEILSLGTKPVADCMGCGKCRETGACVFGDIVNENRRKGKDRRWFCLWFPGLLCACERTAFICP